MSLWKLREGAHLDQFRSLQVNQQPVYTARILEVSETRDLYRFVTEKARTKHRARVYNADGVTSREDTYFRDCFSYGEEALRPHLREIRSRILEMVHLAVEYYGGESPVEVTPNDPYQVLGYDVAGKFLPHADSHQFDSTLGTWVCVNPRRKISVVLALCDQVEASPSVGEFTGGSLVFHNLTDVDGNPFELHPVAGVAACFPSSPAGMHEVTPVTSGLRISVVNWFDYK